MHQVNSPFHMPYFSNHHNNVIANWIAVSVLGIEAPEATRYRIDSDGVGAHDITLSSASRNREFSRMSVRTVAMLSV
eukprot:2104599-Amphidinium_carterae.2